MSGARATTLFDMREAVVNEVSDEVIDDAIERRASLLSRRNKAEQPKDRELVTQRRHRELERTCEISDRHLVMRQRVHDPDPGRVPERLEHFAGTLHCFLSWQSRKRTFDLPRVACRRQGRFRDRHAERIPSAGLVRRVLS